MWQFLQQPLELLSLLARGTPTPPFPNLGTSNARAAVEKPARARRMGGCEGSPGPAPCAPIKPRNQSRPLSGFLVTLGGTTRALPPLVSHRSLDARVLPVPERRLRLYILPDLGRSPHQQVGSAGWADTRCGGGAGRTDLRVLETGSVLGEGYNPFCKVLCGLRPIHWAQPCTPLELQRPSPLYYAIQILRSRAGNLWMGAWLWAEASPAGPSPARRVQMPLAPLCARAR